MTAEPLVQPEIGRVRFDLAKSAWLWGMVVVGVALGVPALTWPLTALSFLLAYLTLCLGHSAGLHRGIIHRTYRTSRAVRGTLAYLFVLSGLGGPLAWARLHAVRDHWQNQADCPRYFAYRHSLWRDFLWNLHTTFVPADDRAAARLPADVLEDRWLRFLDRTWRFHVLGLGAVCFVTLGAGAATVCVAARTAAGILGHWFVGYAAHTWGERRFAVPGATESGTNLRFLGVASFGEGFHNNHHAFPRSARMGLRPREFDLGWMSLLALEGLGLVSGVRDGEPSPRPEAMAEAVSAFPLRDVLAAGCREPGTKQA